MKPLFVTGLARGGTNLVARILDAHSHVSVAVDPYFPLFRQLRDAIVLNSGLTEIVRRFERAQPFQDHYFRADGIAILDAFLSSSEDISFDTAIWDGLRSAVTDRTKHECSDLTPNVDKLLGATWKQVLENGLEIISDARCQGNETWVGLKEVWIIDMVPYLAHMFPEAKFVIIDRDPRDIITSVLGFLSTGIPQVAQPLSIARHWRKSAALSRHYLSIPLLENRVMKVRMEDIVASPEHIGRQLCEFLGIEFEPGMLDVEKFENRPSGEKWTGNSVFEKNLTGFNSRAVGRWRNKLPQATQQMIEFVCGADMNLAGYKVEEQEPQDTEGAINYILQTNHDAFDWRCDFQDPIKDLGFELFRNSLLHAGTECSDPDTIRRCFLFRDTYDALRAANWTNQY